MALLPTQRAPGLLSWSYYFLYLFLSAQQPGSEWPFCKLGEREVAGATVPFIFEHLT